MAARAPGIMSAFNLGTKEENVLQLYEHLIPEKSIIFLEASVSLARIVSFTKGSW